MIDSKHKTLCGLILYMTNVSKRFLVCRFWLAKKPSKFWGYAFLQRKNEFGRTLLETMTVLVLMALLTLTGFHMYKDITERAKAEVLEKRIQAMAFEHQVNSVKRTLTSNARYTLNGPYNISLTLEDGTAGNLREYFWITVPAQQSSFCEELKKSTIVQAEFVTINGDKQGACPGEIAFYFPKNSSNAKALITYMDDNGKQQVCPKNAICTTDSFDCVDGYYKSGNNCQKCSDHVATCQDGTTPLTCEDGYYLDEGECISCPEEDPTCERVCPRNQAYDEIREKCVPVCNTTSELTCSNETDVWCCGDGLICDYENQTCKDGGGMCSYSFYEATADTTYYTDCSYSVSAADNIASYYTDCSYTIGAITNGTQSVTPTTTRGGCPENQYCSLLWIASGWGANDAEPKVTNGVNNRTLYGKCQMLASYSTTPLIHYVNGNGRVVPVGGTRGGCPENQYCALLWTASSWTPNDTVPNVTNTVSNRTLYGKCQMLASYSTKPLMKNGEKDGTYEIKQGCSAGKYCLLKWRQESCTGVQNGDTLVYGTCVDLNKNSGNCPYN